MSKTLEQMIKKLKAHERTELIPLYQKHANYLLRLINSVEMKKTSFIINIPTFTKVATCHEIAIVNYSTNSDWIETHQNPLGFEEEYTDHPKAKNVSRDLRVRIIWKMIEREFSNNPELEGFEAYEEDEMGKITYHYCPVCREAIYENCGTDGNIIEDNNCSCYYENSFPEEIMMIVGSKTINQLFKVHGIYVDAISDTVLPKNIKESILRLYDHYYDIYTEEY